MSKYEDFIDSSFELYDAKLRLEQAKTDLAFTRILALVGWIGFMVATALVSYSAEADEYQDGYEQGYQEAKCEYQNGCVPPVAPVPTIPATGEDSATDGYRAGIEQAESEQ